MNTNSSFWGLALILMSTVLFSCEEDGLSDVTMTEPTSLNCPSSHPYQACARCWEDAAQAASGGCNQGGNSNDGGNNDSGNNDGGINDGGNNNSGECAAPNWNPNNTACVQTVANGTGCLNSDGYFVSLEGVVSNPCNSRLAILDIENNLGIDIDDSFIAECGYQGAPPSINPTILVSDALIYFKALMPHDVAEEFASLLNTNGDAYLTRNEASMAKGSDPLQILNLPPEIVGQGGGLATDDILAYIGMYLGDGAVDKYAGDLNDEVKAKLLNITRSWQPGTSGTGARYDDETTSTK